MSWPQAFHDVGIAVSVTACALGFFWVMAKGLKS